jgi:hypothetical protein
MGISIFPIGIKLDEIKKVFGSKNNELFVRLISTAIYHKYDEEYSFKHELEELLYKYVPLNNRTVKPPKLFGLIKGDDGRGLDGEWLDYAFALLILCYELGEQFLSYDEDIKINEYWNQLSNQLKQISPAFDLNKLLQAQQIFDTPYSKNDDVKMSLLNKAEVHHFKNSLDAYNTNINEKSDLFNQIYKIISVCEEKKLELIVFNIDRIED